MINSMFSLDHRLAELRPSESEQRNASLVRDAAASAGRVARSAGTSVRHAFTVDRYAGQASRQFAG